MIADNPTQASSGNRTSAPTASRSCGGATFNPTEVSVSLSIPANQNETWGSTTGWEATANIDGGNDDPNPAASASVSGTTLTVTLPKGDPGKAYKVNVSNPTISGQKTLHGTIKKAPQNNGTNSNLTVQ